MIIEKKGKIIYPVIPSRFNEEQVKKIIEFIASHGHAPLDHRHGLDYKHFEHGIGRERTLKFLIDIMFLCEAIWIFGASDGGMSEWKNMLDKKGNGMNIRIFPEFDPEWQKYYDSLTPKYGDLFARQRNLQRLFVIVGPRAIGKTYLTNRILEHFSENLARPKTNTDRKPRRDKLGNILPVELESYNFLTTEEFEQGINQDTFFEWDNYHGIYYGSSFRDIYKVFDRGQHGIVALTPPGAMEYYKVRDKINLTILCFKPESDEVMLRNFSTRKFKEKSDIKKYLEESKNFAPPAGVEYETIMISGDADTDEKRIITAMGL